MMSPSSHDVILSAVTCLVLVTSSLTQSVNRYENYEVSSLGVVATLHCNNTSQQSIDRSNDSYPVSWMLPYPGLNIINQNTSKYQFRDSMWTLEINDTQTTDLGSYHCMLKNSIDDWYLVRVGLNNKGPFFVDPWDTYKLNTVIAFSALVGFLLLTAAVLLIYYYRYIPEEVQEEERVKRESQAIGVFRSVGSFSNRNEYPMTTMASNSSSDTGDDGGSDVKGDEGVTAPESIYPTLAFGVQENDGAKVMSAINEDDVGNDNKTFSGDDVVNSDDVKEIKEEK